jgi:hypothetical protein
VAQGKKPKAKARTRQQLAFMATSLERGYVPLTGKQKRYFKRVLAQQKRGR